MSARIALVAVVATVFASPAFAQRPTGGLLTPHADIAAGDHAEAVQVNPAGIAFGERLQLSYTYIGTADDRSGQGHGAWLSLGLADPYHTGLALNWLQTPDAQGTAPVKLTWSHAIRLDPAISLGLAWSHFFVDAEADDPGRAYDGVDTLDLGVQIRPSRWLAAGVLFTDLDQPLLGEEEVERGYEFGVSVRPGLETVDLMGHARVEEGDGTTTFGARLRARLFGRFALVARWDTTRDDGQRVMLGLSDEGQAGGGLFWYAPDVTADDGRAGFAVSGRVRSRVEPMPSILKRPIVAEVEVGALAEYGVSGLLFPTARAPFLRLMRRLRALERHDEVAAVLLAFTSDEMGWGQAAELRTAIARLRKAGKKVYAWLPVGNTRTYSVAAAADRIYTTHAGGVLLTGVRAELTYVGTLLERLGITAEFAGTGAYKSAPEMFTRRGPSPASTLQQTAILDHLYGRAVGAIAAGRGLTDEAVKGLIDDGPYTAAAAEKAGLVDGVIHYDEFDGVMREALGPRATFAPVDALLDRRSAWWGAMPRIGVLYAVGTLADGPSTSNPFSGSLTTGSETLARAAEAMRVDRRVEAVVLRIDSPGGSVTASDVMWRALARLAEEKPLIVSMGDVAASGGYYIAAAGHTILATPDTITGSIGVFSGKFDLGGLYRGLGVETVPFARGKRSGLLSMTAPWTDDERAAVSRSMHALYELFLDRVSAGRPNLNRQQVEPLAGGRVWTGAAARACGLVDRPEGLMTAIDLAAISAGLGDGEFVIKVGPAPGDIGALPSSPLGRMLEGLAGWLGAGAVAPGLPALLTRALDTPVLQFASGTPLALLPFVVD